MKLPQELTTVTPFSRIFALLIVMALPIIGFLMGVHYQQLVDLYERQTQDLFNSSSLILRRPTPTPDETANWKTYNYFQFGYSFKLPANYRITTEKLSHQALPQTIQILNLNERNASQGKNDFIVSVQAISLNSVFQEMVRDGFTKTGSKMINGNEWTIITSSVETEYLFQAADKTYTVEGRNTSLLEQILQTFKFTQ